MKRSGMQPVARRTSSGRIHSPTRERILELVGNADQGLALSAIAATTGLHENTVRAHLEALLEDGYLLRKAAEATGRRHGSGSRPRPKNPPMPPWPQSWQSNWCTAQMIRAQRASLPGPRRTIPGHRS